MLTVYIFLSDSSEIYMYRKNYSMILPDWSLLVINY